jgi:hypothetical protein
MTPVILSIAKAPASDTSNAGKVAARISTVGNVVLLAIWASADATEFAKGVHIGEIDIFGFVFYDLAQPVWGTHFSSQSDWLE